MRRSSRWTPAAACRISFESSRGWQSSRLKTMESAPPVDSAEGALTRSHEPYAILRNGDFVYFLVGRLVSSFGLQMLTVAVGWELYERTHSALALGLVGLAQMGPMILFTLPAGHVADNFNRKRIIILTTFIIACASAGLAVVSALKADVFWIYFCIFM